jgi:serine/threonine protein kinase
LFDKMSLAIGSRLGPYEILAPIGSGGMGEVYRARDTRLKREVALKVLPDSFASDPDRMARFQREAELLASLNHPRIATIYGVEEHALAMELVEGEALASPLPIQTALEYARQIAEALEYAHERGVIHRDLKPANIKVTPEGTVKLLDFGLAKAIEDPIGSTEDPAHSPTLTLGATRLGLILGTAAYMSPEQANGKPADRRADIWSFGAVLYEMLSGKRAFSGESVSDTLASVLKLDPDWDALPSMIPPSIRKLVRRCLKKDRKQRLQAIGEARIEIDEALSAAPEETPPQGVTAPRGNPLWKIAALVLAVLAAALAVVHFDERAPEPRSVRFQIPPPEKSSIEFFQLSPDGRVLAFTTTDRRLWTRALDSLQAQPLPATDGAAFPFWSPDSRYIAFFAPGKLKRIAASGGPPQILGDVGGIARGGAWNPGGLILFSPKTNFGLFRVPATGGVPVQATAIGKNSASTHAFPDFLPDGRHFIYTVFGAKADESGIYVGSLDGKPSLRLLSDPSNAIYAGPQSPGRSGHLLFRRGDTLMAQPFDVAQFRLIGDLFPVAERVGTMGTTSIFGAFSLSENGTLAYGSGSSATSQLVWVDRAGKPIGSIGPPASYFHFRLAPDEKRIVFDSTDQSGNQDIWVLDSIRGVTSRLTFDPAIDNLPIWSPDGVRIVWPSNRGGSFDLYIKSANGTGPEELLLKMGSDFGWATDWSKDGRFILYQRPGEKTGQDLWIAPLSGDRKPYPYLQTQFEEQDGQFSPDGKWVAYSSNESGQYEVYVQSFPPSGAKFPISSGGGSEPQWRNDGKELFYLVADQTLMATAVELGRSASEPFWAGLPKPLINVPPASTIGRTRRSYAVSNDGQRFLITDVGRVGNASPLTVVLNWQARLKE